MHRRSRISPRGLRRPWWVSATRPRHAPLHAAPALPHATCVATTCSGCHLQSHATTQAAEAARRYTASHEEAGQRRSSWGGGGSGAGAGAAGGAAGGAAVPSAALSELGLGDVPPHALTPAQAQRACPKPSSQDRRSYPAGPAGPACPGHSPVNHETPTVSHLASLRLTSLHLASPGLNSPHHITGKGGIPLARARVPPGHEPWLRRGP